MTGKDQEAIYSNCKRDDHSMCRKCYDAISKAELLKMARRSSIRKGSRIKIPCPFPYGNACNGQLDIIMATDCGINVSFDIEATCPSCKKNGRYSHELSNALFFTHCHFCSSKFCSRCECDPCKCDNVQYREAWSRYIRCNGIPVRKKDSLNACHTAGIAIAIADVDDASGYGIGHHVGCPECGIRLYKDSACNELQHCHATAVCYACGSSAHPWEKALPSDHWDNCPRWDYQDIEAIHSGFICVEGKCYGAGIGDCVIPSHQGGIQAYNSLRGLRYVRGFHGKQIK